MASKLSHCLLPAGDRQATYPHTCGFVGEVGDLYFGQGRVGRLMLLRTVRSYHDRMQSVGCWDMDGLSLYEPRDMKCMRPLCGRGLCLHCQI